MAAQMVDEVVRAKPDEHLIVVPASASIAEAVALMVDNIEIAQDTLAAKGFTMITEADLQEEDE